MNTMRTVRGFAPAFLALGVLFAQGCDQGRQKENESLKADLKTVQQHNAELHEKLASLEVEKTILTINIETLEKQIPELEQALAATNKAAGPKRQER